MSFLDSAPWSKQFYGDGWYGASAEAPVIEPATSDQLATSGVATAADVLRAAARADEAQREWSATPAPERAAGGRRREGGLGRGFGSCLHQGQICVTSGRHLVHESLAEEYTASLVAKADALPVGNPATEDVALGPIIDSGQLERVDGLVQASIAAGAILAAGEGAHRLAGRLRRAERALRRCQELR